jgi:hypothetical protein
VRYDGDPMTGIKSEIRGSCAPMCHDACPPREIPITLQMCQIRFVSEQNTLTSTCRWSARHVERAKAGDAWSKMIHRLRCPCKASTCHEDGWCCPRTRDRFVRRIADRLVQFPSNPDCDRCPNVTLINYSLVWVAHGSTVLSPWFLWSRITTINSRSRSWGGWDAASVSTKSAMRLRYDCLAFPKVIFRHSYPSEWMDLLTKSPMQ